MSLSTVIGDNGWTYVQGMTGPQSKDPLGPRNAATTLPHPGVGSHYVGWSQPRDSTIVLRAYFDPSPRLPSGNMLGYVQYVEAFARGAPISPSLLPGYRSRRFYETNRTALDFMGPKDVHARLASDTGQLLFAAPFYALNGLLGSVADASVAARHPSTHGSILVNAPPVLRRADLPAKALAPSLRTVFNTALIDAEQLRSVCTDAAADYDIAGFDPRGLSLDAAILALFHADGYDPQPFIDFQAAGDFLILLQAEGGAIVARQSMAGQPARPRLQLWQLEHDIHDELEQAAVRAVLANAQSAVDERYPQWADRAAPRKRGWSGLVTPPALAYGLDADWNNQPPLALRITSVIVSDHRTSPRFNDFRGRAHSAVETTVAWRYDTTADRFSLAMPDPPRLATPSQAMLQALQQLYTAGGLNPPADDTPDLSVFTLAGLPVVDDAPPRVADPDEQAR